MKASILTLSWVLALVTAEKACHTGCMKLAAPGTSTIDYDYGAPSSTLTQPGGPIITARRTGDQLTQVVTPLSTSTMEFDVTYTALPRSVAHECDSGNCVTIGLPGGVCLLSSPSSKSQVVRDFEKHPILSAPPSTINHLANISPGVQAWSPGY